MMSFLLFIIVLIINYNCGTARPTTDTGLKHISKNGLISSETDKNGHQNNRVFKLPTIMQEGLSIAVSGILETRNKTFTVILRDNDVASENCKMTLDFQKETITVTSSIGNSDSASYNLQLQMDVEAKFSLSLIARVIDQEKHLLAFSFQANDEGESPQLICDVKSFENITHIEMREGVSRVNSLLFKSK